MTCGDTGGTGSGSGGPILPDPEGPIGGGTSPVGGGGLPKHGLTPSDCQQGLDCENCNIPGDTNGDCILSYDEVQAIYNPCIRASQGNTKAKLLLEQTKIKNKVTEATAGVATNTVEKGFNFGTDSNGGYTAGNVKTGTQYHVELPPTEPGFTVKGSVHTHPSSGFDSFSAGDLYGFRTAYGANSSFETVFVFGYTGEVYNLMITDSVKFQEFLNNYPKAEYENNGDWKIDTPIRNDMVNLVRKMIDQGKTPNEAYALAHAFVLRKYNTGMSIAKKQPDGSFKTLFVEEKQNPLDSNETIYNQTDNCNL